MKSVLVVIPIYCLVGAAGVSLAANSQSSSANSSTSSSQSSTTSRPSVIVATVTDRDVAKQALWDVRASKRGANARDRQAATLFESLRLAY
jgi:hypothetical protein